METKFGQGWMSITYKMFLSLSSTTVEVTDISSFIAVGKGTDLNASPSMHIADTQEKSDPEITDRPLLRYCLCVPAMG